jgi:hypothetical protein
MKEVIQREEMKMRRAALEVMWVSAGRGDDIRHLMTEEVEPRKDGTRIRFIIGKTANAQPYTVSTAALSLEARGYITARQEEMRGKKRTWLFPGLEVEHLLKAVRRVDPALGTRSVRRGALQRLASTGLTDEELMAYSQHKCVQTLRRYLDFGWESGEGRARARKAKRIL